MTADKASRLLPRQTIRQILKKIQDLGPRALCAAIIGLSFGAVAGVEPAHSASHVENACKMMQSRASWYSSAKAASQKWQIPIPPILAIIRQESRFKATAASRRSSAYGFAQALDGTWNAYRRATKSPAADRSSFADSVDFIAWYMTETRKRTGLAPQDIANHYIAYHEGHGGYQSTRWVEKPRLISIAQKVAETAWTYEQQLQGCVIAERVIKAPDASILPQSKPFALSQVAAVAPRPKPIDRYVAILNSAFGSSRTMTRLH